MSYTYDLIKSHATEDSLNSHYSYEIKRLESENSGNLVVDLTNKTASAEQK